MKSKFFALLAIVALVGFTGCCGGGKCWRPFGGHFGGGCADACCDDGCCETGCGETCCEAPCEPARCGLLDGMRCGAGCGCGAAPAGGPMTGTVAYPYYTNRGPRDFLAANPPSIGP